MDTVIPTINTCTGHLDFPFQVQPARCTHGMAKITLDDVQTLLKSPDICSRWLTLIESCHLRAQFVNHVATSINRYSNNNPHQQTPALTLNDRAAQLKEKIVQLE